MVKDKKVNIAVAYLALIPTITDVSTKEVTFACQLNDIWPIDFKPNDRVSSQIWSAKPVILKFCIIAICLKGAF